LPKPCAYNRTRREICYRHDAFSAGLRAAGYDVRAGAPQGGPDAVLLIWNRYGQYHELATQFEAAGGTVIVAENGYLGPGGIAPHAMNPRTVFALGRGAHNDSTAIPAGGPERWQFLGVDLKPWRADGGHVLVCPNRSFGTPGRIMPSAWGADICTRLRKLTKREVRLRAHPGNESPKKPLAEDLLDCWAMVIWASSAGVHALVAGVPVICEGPRWICHAAASVTLTAIDHPPLPERQRAFERMAWAQWHLSEIESGEAFDHLLRPARQGKVTASA
jgi:hypothetical protein